MHICRFEATRVLRTIDRREKFGFPVTGLRRSMEEEPTQPTNLVAGMAWMMKIFTKLSTQLIKSHLSHWIRMKLLRFHHTVFLGSHIRPSNGLAATDLPLQKIDVC